MRSKRPKDASRDPPRLGSGGTEHVVAVDNGDLQFAGHLLKPACDIHRIADDCELKPALAADLAEDDLAAMDADADEEFRQAGRRSPLVPRGELVNHLAGTA